MDILEIITKYWLEFLLGIIATTIIGHYKLIKDKWKDYKEMKEKEKKETFKKDLLEAVEPIIKEYAEKSDCNDARMQDTLGSLQQHLSTLNEQVVLITHGVLSMQGRVFKSQCHELLEREGSITADEYNRCMKDHTLYNQLGGNSDGDQLFELVTEKYKHHL